MLGTDFYVFLLAMVLAIVLLFMMVWHLIMVDELKNDYRNPVDFCQNLNRCLESSIWYTVDLILFINLSLVIPEYAIHIVVVVMLLMCGYWFTFFFNVPLLAYHIYRYVKRPTMSGPGLYDPTEVMNRAQMTLYTREGFIKVGFYVVSFLVYLYNMMVALVMALT